MTKRTYIWNEERQRKETTIWGVVGMSEQEVDQLEIHAIKAGKSLSQFLGPLMLQGVSAFLEANPINLAPKPKAPETQANENAKTPHKFVSSTRLPAQFCGHCERKKNDPVHRIAPAANTTIVLSTHVDHSPVHSKDREDDKAVNLGSLVAHFAGRKPQPTRRHAA